MRRVKPNEVREGQITERERHHNAVRMRLGLKPYRVASVGEVDEASRCVGCVAEWRKGVRVVHVVPGCPVHSR